MPIKVKNIELKKLEIPFRISFKHAAKERVVTETVIAVAQSDGETCLSGYGEGCPRSYVTGETVESAATFLYTHLNTISKIDRVESLLRWVTKHVADIDNNPAAWCAIEMALLDLFAKTQKVSVEALLGFPEVYGQFLYSAVLGVSTPSIFQTQLAEYLSLGMTDFKVKVSGDYALDKSNFNRIINAIPNARIRLDANNLWNNTNEAIEYILSLGIKFWAIEEPLAVGNYSDLKKLAGFIETKIILDESFLRAEQFKNIQDAPGLWIPNIRISKMGGILRSVEIAKLCRTEGLKFIIGAQVGETSLLTRSALLLANNYRNCVLSQEGAFGTYLLRHDITANPIMFGLGGIVDFVAGGLTDYGLGIECNL